MIKILACALISGSNSVKNPFYHIYDISSFGRLKLFDYQDLTAIMNKKSKRTYSLFVKHNQEFGYLGFHLIMRDLDDIIAIHEDVSIFDTEGKKYYYRNNKPRILEQDLLENSIENLSHIKGFNRVIDYMFLLKKQLIEFQTNGFSNPW
ncbi:Uncharacterised protein [uncultured archaeon]|nr:Uncharacterised protein [uncultured archaeon]